jgi:hypothetical protein
MNSAIGLPIPCPFAAAARSPKTTLNGLHGRHLGTRPAFMGYHGILWASMGMGSKNLVFRGIYGALTTLSLIPRSTEIRVEDEASLVIAATSCSLFVLVTNTCGNTPTKGWRKATMSMQEVMPDGR